MKFIARGRVRDTGATLEERIEAPNAKKAADMLQIMRDAFAADSQLGDDMTKYLDEILTGLEKL